MFAHVNFKFKPMNFRCGETKKLSKVFISHSKREKKLINEIQSALDNIGITPIIEEFIDAEKKQPIPWKEILGNVRSSKAVYLFLTDEVVETEYTKNWVIFEDGLASALGKQLFLFEREGIPLKYPIPYVTDYMIFEKERTEDILTIQKISKHLKKYFSVEETLITNFPLGHPVYDSMSNMFLYSLYYSLKTRGKRKKLKALGVKKVKCPKCNTSFYYYSPEKSPFSCPSCRSGRIEVISH